MMLRNGIDPLPSAIKRDIKTAVCWLKSIGGNKGSWDNIFFATCQKSGSQWILSIFEDKRIKKITQLSTYPQHHYDINEFHMRFPKGHFIPGLYISYPWYELFIKKTNRYKTFYVYRDPRDIVVSWYYSALETHAPNLGVNQLRAKLQSMSKDDGLIYAIKFLGGKFHDIRSWIELGSADENVMLMKFEDFISDPQSEFAKLFRFLGLGIDKATFDQVLFDHSKDAMRKKDMETRKDGGESHYRKSASSYIEHFKDDHFQLFYQMTGDLIEKLGYIK